MNIFNIDRATRARGMMLGHLIGDAMGSAYEFKQPFEELPTYQYGVFGHAPGTGTDDTAVLRCTVGAIQDGVFDQERYLTLLSEWAATGPLDIGGQTRKAIKHWEANGTPIGADPQGFDAGNGALMGCAPLAFLHPWNWEAAARALSESTHPSVESLHACTALVGACSYMLDGPDAGLPPMVGTLTEHWDPAGSKMGWCQGTLSLAFKALGDVVAGWATPIEALQQVIQRGGDTDTNGAVAGALLGCAYGDGAWQEPYIVSGLDQEEVTINLTLAEQLAAIV